MLQQFNTKQRLNTVKTVVQDATIIQPLFSILDPPLSRRLLTDKSLSNEYICPLVTTIIRVQFRGENTDPS